MIIIEGNGSVSSTTLMDALEPIDMNDVLAALQCTKASTSVKANKYEKWQDEYDHQCNNRTNVIKTY